MKVIKESSKVFAGDIVSTYDFEQLNNVNDALKIIDTFIRSGVDVKSVKVSELGDIGDGGKTVIYTDITKVGLIRTDFSGRVIECFDIVGYYNNYKLVASIYPNANRLIISYPPQCKAFIDNMIGSLSKTGGAYKNQ